MPKDDFDGRISEIILCEPDECEGLVNSLWEDMNTAIPNWSEAFYGVRGFTGVFTAMSYEEWKRRPLKAECEFYIPKPTPEYRNLTEQEMKEKLLGWMEKLDLDLACKLAGIETRVKV